MTRELTARDLFDNLKDRLDLQWSTEDSRAPDKVLSDQEASANPALAGYLNLIHPNRVQVLGQEEIDYLSALSQQHLDGTISRIFDDQLLAVIVGQNLDVPEKLADAARQAGTPLMRSGKTSYELVNFLQYYISRVLAPRCTMHGVFMEVFTIGVLITGDAGCGKSELALEMLNRGHRLVADDAPEFTLVSPEIIDGSCPAAIQDCLEVRGLGLLNVPQMFGDTAIKSNKYLRLIIQLQLPNNVISTNSASRLKANETTRRVLGLDIPQISLDVQAGRNMAVILEAAARDFMLRMKGYDAAAVFIDRHTKILREQTSARDE